MIHTKEKPSITLDTTKQKQIMWHGGPFIWVTCSKLYFLDLCKQTEGKSTIKTLTKCMHAVEVNEMGNVMGH